MHPCMIILVDLYDGPTNKEAAASRALIDELFKLSGFVNSLDTADCHEEWVMLLRLRSIVWHRVGLDPSLFWTEAQHHRATASPRFRDTGVVPVAGQEPPHNRPSQTQRDPRSESTVRKISKSPRLSEDLLPFSQQSFAWTHSQAANLEEAIAPKSHPELLAYTSERQPLDLTGSSDIQSLGAVEDATLLGTITSNSTNLGDLRRHAGKDAKVTHVVDVPFDWEAWDAVFGHAVFDVDICSADWIDAQSFTSQDSRSP